MRGAHALRRAALGSVAWLLLLYLAAPLLVIFAVSFTETRFLKFPPSGFTLSWYVQFFEDPSYMGALWLSLRLASVVTVISLLLGVSAGFVLSRYDFPGRQTVATAFLSPLVLPTVVLGVAMLQAATMFGFARTFLSLVIGHVVVVIPYVVRTTLGTLARFDTITEEAAQDLGARPMTTFLLVTLPQIKPGIIAGGLFAFIISYSNIEVSIFQSRQGLITFPVKLFDYVQYSLDPLLAAASAITILFAVAAIIILDWAVGIDRAVSGR
ncbi:MAG: ABC transporter permease [Acetobacteraceae bacterium]